MARPERRENATLMETDLPDCHSRHILESSSMTFFCSHPRVHTPGGRVTPRICLICQLWREPAPELARAVATSHLARREACEHLGGESGLRECTTCQGHVRVKTFVCAHPA